MQYCILIFFVLTSCAVSNKFAPIIGFEGEEMSEIDKDYNLQHPYRGLGSLWSDNSSWNEFYQINLDKSLGDFLEVEIDDYLKKKLFQKFKKKWPEYLPHKPVVTTSTTNNTQQNNTNEPEVVDVKDSVKIKVFIKKINPKGLYWVFGENIVQMNNTNIRLKIKGQIKNKEIDNKNSISSARFLHLAYALSPYIQNQTGQ